MLTTSTGPSMHARFRAFLVAAIAAVVVAATSLPAPAAPLAPSCPVLNAGAVLGQSTSKATKSKSTASKSTADAKKTSGDASGASASREKGLLGRIVQFVMQYKWWILGAVGTGFLGSLLFLIWSGQRQAAEEYEEETVDLIPLPRDRDDEDEGPRRVLIDPETGKPKDLPSRDESEYALVVDEEELHLPHDGTSSGEYEKVVLKVHELVQQKRFDEAWEKYVERIEGHRAAGFHPALERRLAKYFLKQKEYGKAATILEHHVATQPATEIEPEIYFDLGYAYFKERALDRSRHFFGLFAEKERNPAYSDRARRLVESLEKASGK